MKVQYTILRNIHGEDGQLEGQEAVEKELEVAEEVVKPIQDYLAEVGHGNRLEEVLLNGCRTVEQTKQYIDDLENDRFY
jgi:hypothetical protein